MTAMLETPDISATALNGEASRDGAVICGDVVCEIVAGRSALTRVWATDPLKLLTPRTHGHAKQVVLSTYGGGLLGGDKVSVRATVKPGARLLVTTQSSSKIYRTESAPGSQVFQAIVDADALLAVLPDPVCAFANSRLHQRQQYTLAGSATLVYLDWLTSGRHGRGERWAMSNITSRTEIEVAGKMRLRETLSLDAGAGEIGSMLRVGRFDCYAVLVMMGPLAWPMVELGRDHVRGMVLAGSPAVLASEASIENGVVFRIFGRDVQVVQTLLGTLLQPLTQVLGQNPWGRKW